MIEVVQLCYIFTILIAISAFSLQYLARRKNLAVTNQYIKGRMATLFLALILLFNVCDFLLLFLGTALDIASTDWIYVVENVLENVLEVALAYVLMGMERDYLGKEERKGSATFFAVIAAVIFWTDTTYTAGIMITSESVYTAVMIGLNLLPVLAVAAFSVRNRRSLMAVSRKSLTEGYFLIYNLVFIFLCVVSTVSILDSRTDVDYVGNDKELYVVFWFLFNLLNFFLVWRSCRTVEEMMQTEAETPEAVLNRLAEDYHLSQREKEIATLLCKGKNNNDIAAYLFLSPNTVKVHTSNLYRKLGVKNRVQAVQILRGGSLEE
ncbi:MAG: response regulator transcription factor [Firmicutes bacterium]|nr:response regulator transcription factor [Bacillota bacterium]MDY5856750.1 response regulator transcription factor [Anaerovoracaceae bacterium]